MLDLRPNPSLITRRKAAHVLNELTKSLGFGSKAERFDPEDYNNWTHHGDDLVIAKRNTTTIAKVKMLDGTRRYLTIPRWDGLIRTEHLSDFNPANYGLVQNNSADVLFEEEYPDSEGEVDFGDPPGLALPPHPIVKSVRHRVPKVIL